MAAHSKAPLYIYHSVHNLPQDRTRTLSQIKARANGKYANRQPALTLKNRDGTFKASHSQIGWTIHVRAPTDAESLHSEQEKGVYV